MEEFRSRSCGDGRMQAEVYGSRTVPPSGLHDLRCYSASFDAPHQAQPPKDTNFNKGKGTSVGSSSSKGGWGFGDPELQRKKRVASYKVYAMEGKMKGSFRKSFRWLKQVVHGWW